MASVVVYQLTHEDIYKETHSYIIIITDCQTEQLYEYFEILTAMDLDTEVFIDEILGCE